MEITGRRTRSIFSRYHIVAQKERAEALQRMGGFLADQKGRPATPATHGWPSHFAQDPHNPGSPTVRLATPRKSLILAERGGFEPPVRF